MSGTNDMGIERETGVESSGAQRSGAAHGSVIPGEVSGPDGVIVINAGLAVTQLQVMNGGDRPIQVGSHYHFAESNPALRFDRSAARGCRLDIPAGTSVRFEPGVERVVSLVPFTGDRIVAGFRGDVGGALDV